MVSSFDDIKFDYRQRPFSKKLSSFNDACTYMRLVLESYPNSRCRVEKTDDNNYLIIVERKNIPSQPVEMTNGTMVLKCLDGEMKFSDQPYRESVHVRECIDNSQDWISAHTIRDVADELEALYYKNS